LTKKRRGAERLLGLSSKLPERTKEGFTNTRYLIGKNLERGTEGLPALEIRGIF